MTPSSHISRLNIGIAVVATACSCLWIPIIRGEDHWAYQEMRRLEVSEKENPVDFFIEKRLRENEISPADPADRYTLLRRISLTLTGLPPTRAEIATFVSDSSPGSLKKMIDHYLGSPHYGERWGRHWLDVARYVQGTIKVPGVDRIDLAEPYRDYVVRSFNEDKPYDQFLTEQIAGDLLAGDYSNPENSFAHLVAPAFLSIGPWFEECTDPNKLRLDIVDEQISTATRAFLALDFACSRCHDHKVDPIPTRDYYALAGIFRSTEITERFSEEWKDGRPRLVRYLMSETEKEQLREHERKTEKLLNERDRILKAANTRGEMALKNPATDAGIDSRTVATVEAEDFAGHKNLKTISIGSVEALASRRQKDQWTKYRVILPETGEYTLLARYAADRPTPTKLEIEGQFRKEPVFAHPTFGESENDFRWIPIPLGEQEKGSLHFRFLVPPNQAFPILDAFRIVSGSVDTDSPTWREFIGIPNRAQKIDFLLEEDRNKIDAVESQLVAHFDTRPEFDPVVTVMESEPIALPVHVGGNVYETEGEPVPRSVPSLADHLIEKEFEIGPDQSGRLQLSQWLTHPEHPLTARVLVNRIWHWHFGTGLVRTTDDFGKQGASPSHPELLDWLARELIANEWSIKHIQRLILASKTFQRSSDPTPEIREKDPAGEFLSFFPERRLEVEAIYDSMLASIGKVPRQTPGMPLDTSLSKDRALYILTSARSPLGLGLEIRKMFDLFGFDDSGRPMHDRDESTTPQQALFWLNNPLPKFYADALAERILEEEEAPLQRIEAVYEITLGRPPEKQAETAILSYLDELSDQGVDEKEAWARVCLGLFSSHSFRNLP